MNKTGRRLVKLTDLIIVFAIALVSVFLIFFNLIEAINSLSFHRAVNNTFDNVFLTE